MNLRRLRYFLVIAEERSISRAAERLYIAQPSLSQQLLQFERELGVELFDRSQRPLALTVVGSRLLTDARRLLDEVDRVTATVERARRGETGLLRVGFIYGGLYHVVLAALRRFRARHPEVSVELQPVAASEQFAAVRSHAVDLVFARLTAPGDDDVSITLLREERLLAILPDHHPATNVGHVDLRDLAGEPFALAPRRFEPLVFDRQVEACRLAGFDPRVEYEVADAQTHALLVASGAAVSLTGDGLALRFPGLAYLPARPTFTLTRLALLHLPAPRAPLHEAFVQIATAGQPNGA